MIGLLHWSFLVLSLPWRWLVPLTWFVMNVKSISCGNFTEVKKKLVVDVRDKDDLELYYKTIPDYFEQDDGRKLTEVPDRTSTDMIEGAY